MPDLLVTGTDTNVGKTVVAAALLMALRAKGIRAIGFKPAQTGYADGQESDADLLERASGEHTPLASPLLQLDEPLAPAVAADRAGTLIGAGDIEARIELLRRAGYSLVIEGAGGVMVPLVWDTTVRRRPDEVRRKPDEVRLKPDTATAAATVACYTVIDLAQRFNLEAIVVGRAGLGTLNHVAMTVAMLRSANIAIRGIVLNGRSPAPDLAESTNPAALARMLPDLAIVEVPQQSSTAACDVIAAAVPLVSRLL